VASQDLMAAFVGNHRCQGKILRVGVALERFGIDGQQVLVGAAAAPVLRAAGLAVNVAVFDVSDEPPLSRDASNAAAASPPFCRRQGVRRRRCHQAIIADLASSPPHEKVPTPP
jgi:hypothetical protein